MKNFSESVGKDQLPTANHDNQQRVSQSISKSQAQIVFSGQKQLLQNDSLTLQRLNNPAANQSDDQQTLSRVHTREKKTQNLTQQQIQFRMGVYGASVGNNKSNLNQQANIEEVDPADGSTGGSGEEDAAAVPAQPVTQVAQIQQNRSQAVVGQKKLSSRPLVQKERQQQQTNENTNHQRNASTGKVAFQQQNFNVRQTVSLENQMQRGLQTSRPVTNGSLGIEIQQPEMKLDQRQLQFYQRLNVSPKKSGFNNYQQQIPQYAPTIQTTPKQGVAAQATAQLLKKELYFSKENIQELHRAGRFGKEPVPQQFAVIPQQLSEHSGRKTLVLDLDETLIHSKFSLPQLQACRSRG